jgi:hypothetical protein
MLESIRSSLLFQESWRNNRAVGEAKILIVGGRIYYIVESFDGKYGRYR